jgi:hypothetical protein
MSTLTKVNSSAVGAKVTADSLQVVLADGREISAPLSWFPRLISASEEQRNDWRLIGAGEGVRWPAIDEDISVASLLQLS